MLNASTGPGSGKPEPPLDRLTDDQLAEQSGLTPSVIENLRKIASGGGTRHSPAEVQAAKFLAQRGHGAARGAQKGVQKTRVVVVEVTAGTCPNCGFHAASGVQLQPDGSLQLPPGARVQELGEQEVLQTAIVQDSEPK